MSGILLISSEFPPGPGGIGTHAYQVASHLGALNREITVIASQDYASEDEIARFNSRLNFPLIRWQSRSFAPYEALYRRSVITQTIRRSKPDCIVASGQRAVWLAASLPRNIPSVAIGHGTEFGASARWISWLTRWAFERADHVICVSEYTRNYMLRVGIKPRRESIIPNGADDTFFEMLPATEVRAFRERHGFREGQLLLTVGNVTERKGQHVVIRALPRILQRFPAVHYLIVGLPTQKKAFEQLAADLGVSEHVHFWGQAESDLLNGLMNACDIFVMTSVHTRSGDFEGYGIAVVEAALCGKPAVVSDNSGLAEAVLDQETGLIVPQNDPEQTAEAIMALLSDDARRQAIGLRARQRALATQTWNVRARAYDSLFSLLGCP
jgi:phosphatidylinositol alpha-1,6-mannosyltransferase